MRILARLGVSLILICLITIAAARAIVYFQTTAGSCTQAEHLQAKDLQAERLYAVSEIRTTSSGGKEITLATDQYKLALYMPELPVALEWGGEYLLSIKKYNSLNQIREQKPELAGFTSYLSSKGICGTAGQVDWGQKIGQRDPIGKFFYQLRSDLAIPLQQALPPDTAALLQALVLGEKNSLDSQSKEQYIHLGVMHVIVVSGFHFTLLSALLWQVLGSNWLPLKKVPLKYKRLLMLLGLLGYLLLLGPGNYSALRAFIGMALAIVTLQLGHPLPLIQRVALVLVLAVIIDPAVLQSVGFQMSYAAWALLALLSPVLQPGRPKLAGSFDAVLAAELTTAVWGTILLMPLSLNLFGSWPIWSIIFGPLLAICLNYLQKVFYISTAVIWIGSALNAISAVTAVFTRLAVPLEGVLSWIKQLKLPDISIISSSSISIFLTCGYICYLIYYLVKNYGPNTSGKILARYSL